MRVAFCPFFYENSPELRNSKKFMNFKSTKVLSAFSQSKDIALCSSNLQDIQKII
jgi:hypothetical protein